CQYVHREAQQGKKDKGTDNRNRNCQYRNKRSSPALQKYKHYQGYQNNGFNQGGYNRSDRLIYNGYRFITDYIIHIFREAFLQLIERGVYTFGRLNRIATRGLHNSHHRGRIVVHLSADIIGKGTQFYTGYIL